jgi:putative membrane protein
MKQTLVQAALAAVGLALVLAVGAEARGGKLSEADRKFVMQAAQGNLLEVRLGELAYQNAASPTVKDLGKRMAKDHTKAYEQLKEVASKHGITLPKDLDAKHQAQAQKFAKLKGGQFDLAYTQYMVEDHEKDFAKFKTAAKEVQAPDLRTWTTQTIPVMQEHLQLAHKLKGTGK